MTRTTNTTRRILAALAVLGSFVFAIILPAAASAAPLAVGAAATDSIPCPLAATPPGTGPVPTCLPCPPPCPPLPTPQPSAAIACPLSGAAASTDAYPICPPPCPPQCPLPTAASSDPVVCPQPATSAASPIIQPCTVSTFQNLGSKFCLDNDTSAARDVFTVACDGARSQEWVFAHSNTTSTIRDLATGLCLTSNATGDVSAVPCISTNPANGPHQWFVTQSGGPLFDTTTGLCLDSPPAPGPAVVPVDTSKCNGTPLQLWLHR
jgi:hypothetical protein